MPRSGTQGDVLSLQRGRPAPDIADPGTDLHGTQDKGVCSQGSPACGSRAEAWDMVCAGVCNEA